MTLISVFVKWANQIYVLYIFAVTCVWNKKRSKFHYSLFVLSVLCCIINQNAISWRPVCYLLLITSLSLTLKLPGYTNVCLHQTF